MLHFTGNQQIIQKTKNQYLGGAPAARGTPFFVVPFFFDCFFVFFPWKKQKTKQKKHKNGYHEPPGQVACPHQG